jgi:AcrR family transcriptional regulator
MSSPEKEDGPGSRRVPLEFIDIAESMFAEHGIGVPLRQICVQAGYRNPSTVQYHFGSRAGLIHAILAQRLPPIDQRRGELLAELDAHDDLRGLADVMTRPLLEINRASRYVEFLVRLGGQPDLHDARVAHKDLSVNANEVQRRILASISALPENVRLIRIRHARDLMFAAIATHSRHSRQAGKGQAAPVDEVFLQGLLDALVGVLRAEHTGPAAS